MNVEIGAEAVLFPEKEYINEIFVEKGLLMGGWCRGHYTESLVYFSTLISSSLFHACNQDIYTGTAA
jgi:hypothetical protein